MAKIRGLKAKIENNPVYHTPRRIYDIESAKSGLNPEEIAATLLRKISPALKINGDLSQLRFDQVKHSILGTHVLYQQVHEGKPISGAWIRLDVDKEGRVYNIMNELLPRPAIEKTKKAEKAISAHEPAKPQLTADEAKQLALTSFSDSGQNTEIVSSELVYFPVNGILTLAWKLIAQVWYPSTNEGRSVANYKEWKLYFDAVNGQLLDQVSLLKQIDGKGQVFDPNPVVTLNNTDLTDTSAIPASAYAAVVLNELDNSGFLDGPFVSTRRTTDRIKKTNFDFRFHREDRPFKEVMVYFHIGRIQRYIQQLGFNNILNQPIEVDIDGETGDNSFYSPVTKSLTFGTGGVDDAEDAEIILHEYGHAIQDNQVPGFGLGSEGKAMGEGFGDFLAASFFADAKPQPLRPTIGNWDATAYSGAEPPCLRRLDSNKKYPKDTTGEEHDDGEIWSACLWELRNLLGRQITERLVIAHHFLLTPRSTFEDGAKALLTTDQQLNQGANVTIIRNVFIRRGILPNPSKGNRRAGASFQDMIARPIQ